MAKNKQIYDPNKTIYDLEQFGQLIIGQPTSPHPHTATYHMQDVPQNVEQIEMIDPVTKMRYYTTYKFNQRGTNVMKVITRIDINTEVSHNIVINVHRKKCCLIL